jgi:hypothetical protein
MEKKNKMRSEYPPPPPSTVLAEIGSERRKIMAEEREVAFTSVLADAGEGEMLFPNNSKKVVVLSLFCTFLISY